MRYIECVKDVFYKYCYDQGYIVIGKCSNSASYDTTIGARIDDSRCSFWRDGSFSAHSYVELASPKEIAWLLACDAADKYIPFNTFNYNIEYEIY